MEPTYFPLFSLAFGGCLVSLTLQGCGGGGGVTTPALTPSTPAPTAPPTSSPTTGPAPVKPLPSFVPMKAISYVSPPCKGLNAEPSCSPQHPADLKVNVKIAWGWESLNSIDNVITSITYYGFQDMIAGVGNPSLAGYKLKGVTQTELMDSYRTRWTNSLNSPSPWHFIQETVDVDYDNYFGGTPWFLSAFIGNDESQDAMEKDFTDTLEESSGGGPFLGVTFMQFQTAYYPQVNGMFDLGTAKIGNGTTGYVCQEDAIRHTPVCERWELFCLESKTPSRVPQAVASAWGGSFESRGLCVPSKSEQVFV